MLMRSLLSDKVDMDKCITAYNKSTLGYGVAAFRRRARGLQYVRWECLGCTCHGDTAIPHKLGCGWWKKEK